MKRICCKIWGFRHQKLKRLSLLSQSITSWLMKKMKSFLTQSKNLNTRAKTSTQMPRKVRYLPHHLELKTFSKHTRSRKLAMKTGMKAPTQNIKLIKS